MIITVKLIATYRDLLPKGTQGNTLLVEAAEGCKATDLLLEFGVPLDNSSVILVNGHTVEEDQVLWDGDVIHAFPALAGG